MLLLLFCTYTVCLFDHIVCILCFCLYHLKYQFFCIIGSFLFLVAIIRSFPFVRYLSTTSHNLTFISRFYSAMSTSTKVLTFVTGNKNKLMETAHILEVHGKIIQQNA